MARYPYEPDYAVPPGLTLRETIDALGIDQSELAARADLSAEHVSQIIKGIAPITHDAAIRLERVTGVPARMWNNLEANYREQLAHHAPRRLEAADCNLYTSFVDAARYQGPVRGYTHNLYKYPARLSPVLARCAIESFSSVGDVVLDPFVGGGTTLIEARLAGRHAFGADISPLAVFVTSVKCIPMSEDDLLAVERWFESVCGRLNIHLPVERLRTGLFERCDRNIPWRLRKLCEQYLASMRDLDSDCQRNLARCVLLRCGQWAMDCRKVLPRVEEFRRSLGETLSQAATAMRLYRGAIEKIHKNVRRTAFQCVQSPADQLTSESFGRHFQGKANLILTSPPYPGVHVLYHRWNVRGRAETPAPFWIAGCPAEQGITHYTMGGRGRGGLKRYFSYIEVAFRNLRQLLADDGLVVQVVGFSYPDWQLDAYLRAMNNAGYKEVMPQEIGVESTERLWRTVPGRRWYSIIRGDISSSKEVVLFHRRG
jgi:addiction module HigA family antidote